MTQPLPDFGLQGRRALVTGSSRGIGLAIARAFAAAGAEVVLNGRDTSVLDAAVAALKSEGYHASGQAFDVTDENAVAAAREATGAIDVLVNNAGIQRRSALVDMSLADWETVISTNLTSAFLVSRAFVPAMIESKAGKIINVCSLMSELARPTTANYAAAKGGLKMLTRAMCGEWAQPNIKINGIGPLRSWRTKSSTAGLRAAPPPDAGVRFPTSPEQPYSWQAPPLISSTAKS